MSSVASAPGKLNLLFRVGETRPDGYHEVFSVYQAVSIREHVQVERSARSGLVVGGSIFRAQLDMVPRDGSNLVFRAAESLARAFPEPGRDSNQLKFEIEKSIPLLGGMAGGSADAAAALIAVAELWGIQPTPAQLLQLGATLGSDVPFALLGGTALGTGRGEVLSQLPSQTFDWVLVFAAEGLSTPEVFRALDAERRDWKPEQLASRTSQREIELETIKACLSAGDASSLAKLLENDLQPIACQLLPHLSETLKAGLGLGALHAQVSGSGPTVFLLAESASHAESLRAEMCKLGYLAVTATGNAPGARLG